MKVLSHYCSWIPQICTPRTCICVSLIRRNCHIHDRAHLPLRPLVDNCSQLLKKAEAKKAAEERAVEKTPMKKSAFKIFREMIGGDLHPGYSVDLPSMEQAKRQK